MAEAAFNYDFGLERAWNEICELGLQKNVADLDAYGYTIVPPEIASPDGFTERLSQCGIKLTAAHGVLPAAGGSDDHAAVGLGLGRPFEELPVGPRSFGTRDLAGLGTAHRPPPIPDNSTGAKLQALNPLPAHRLDGIPPQLSNGISSHFAPPAGFEKSASCNCAQGTRLSSLLS